MSKAQLRGPLRYPLLAYHLGRTVEWGHWGITFMERQPDEAKNFGVIVGHLPFAVSPMGPIDGTVGSDLRRRLQAVCDGWIQHGVKPQGFVPTQAR